MGNDLSEANDSNISTSLSEQVYTPANTSTNTTHLHTQHLMISQRETETNRTQDIIIIKDT
jgi:hypothetical protein